MLEADQLVDRAVAAMACHAIGDAMGAPAENLTPAAIRSRWGRIEGFVTDAPSSTDDTEYGLYTARLLIEHGLDLTSDVVAEGWRRDIAGQVGGFAGAGFSEMATIENLRRGLRPPQTAQHAHAWSDGVAMRAAPFGIRGAGDAELAAELATVDARVSHGTEGIAAARALAAGIARALALPTDGAPARERCLDVARAAMAAAGKGTWTAHTIAESIRIGAQAVDVWPALDELHEALVSPQYYWADLAPEAIGFAFGVFIAADGDPRLSILGGVNIGRDADTIAAMAGSLAGATSGMANVPTDWQDVVTNAAGACIRIVAGSSVAEAAAGLARARLSDAADVVVGQRPVVTSSSEAVRSESSTTPEHTVGPTEQVSGRRRGALLGLAIGEATSWTSMMSAAHDLPGWRRQMFLEIRNAEVVQGITRPVVPFTMNEPSSDLWPAPGEATEWALWTASRASHDESSIVESWAAIAASSPPARGSISTQVALAGLRAGRRPPQTGQRNPHYFDDSAALRAIGIAATSPTVGEALARTRRDASVTSADDGIDAAVAVAAAISTAALSGDLDAAMAAARAQLAPGSWTGRLTEQAMQIAGQAPEPFELAARLAAEVPSYLYSHAVAGAETVAIACALTTAADGDPRTALPAAATLPRFAPGLPAVVGALCGALRGAGAFPSTWVERAELIRGRAVRELAGTRLSEVLAAVWPGPGEDAHPRTSRPSAEPAESRTTPGHSGGY